MNSTIETATLGGGCFWCVEAVYDSVEGVISATSGYAGGTAETANYEAVCSKTTGHAEVVQIKFDASIISYAELLEMFWTAHDPTTPNRQGNDVGPQYRSIIFYHNEAQKQIAEDSIANVGTQVWDDPIVTQLEPLEAFYEAEAYHHDYYAKVGSRNSYCTFVITPKVNKFRKKFAHRLKKTTT
ncbi:MAG: peptide-methionine (S)-S-oxide reductase MsrA [Bacteroidota bacterium]